VWMPHNSSWVNFHDDFPYKEYRAREHVCGIVRDQMSQVCMKSYWNTIKKERESE
jgi:hypothetical protein